MEVSLNIHYERPPGRVCQDPHAKASQRAPGARLAQRLWLQANISARERAPKRWRRLLLGYLVAVLLEVIAASLMLLSVRHLPLFAMQGTLVMLGIVLVALTWGRGPGFLATLVGTALLVLVVLPSFPWFLNNASDVLCVVMFLLVGFSISLIADQN